MPYEDGETLEKTSVLEGMMAKMDPEDRLIVENDIFGSSYVVPISTTFEDITEMEDARSLMSLFRDYIDNRGEKEQKTWLLKEINDFIARRIK